ncbi:MAG: prepilin-type N-terminal cleavage/methylation domain-containing protein, partial [Minisyncoccia bacterium]
MTTKKINKGFTLIEVLLVMVLIGVLLSIGLVSLNTEDRLIETRNNTRQTHIQTLESAITQYKLQEGNYPTGLNRTYQEICDPEATVCTGFFDIKPFLVPTYIQAIPQDPNDSDTTGGSGYEVAVDIATNTVSVRLKATLQEAGVEIKINDPLPAEPTVTANTQLAATVPNLPPVTAVTATGGNITTINENGT